MSFSDLLLMLVAVLFPDSATRRFMALYFHYIRTITAITEIDIHTSLHPRMTTHTLEFHTVAIAIQAFSRDCRWQRVDTTHTVVTENTGIRLLHHFSSAGLVVVV